MHKPHKGVVGIIWSLEGKDVKYLLAVADKAFILKWNFWYVYAFINIFIVKKYILTIEKWENIGKELTIELSWNSSDVHLFVCMCKSIHNRIVFL